MVSTTRLGWRAISSVRLSRTSASEPEVPGERALVLSPMMASTPRLPASSRASTSLRSPSIGAGSSFQSPVWRTRPSRVSSRRALDSGIEWVMWMKRQPKGPSSKLWFGLIRWIGTSPVRPTSPSLRRSTAAVKSEHQTGTAQPAPEIRDGPQMVLVRVGQHEPQQAVLQLLGKAQVGENDVRTRHPVVGEGDAEVDHDPGIVEAVEIDVHADLADPAERHENEAILHSQLFSTGRWMRSRLRS